MESVKLDHPASGIDTWPGAATSLEQSLGNLRGALEQARQELRKARADYESLSLLARRLALDPPSPAGAQLTAQERRVAYLAAVGRSDQEMATALHLSVHTVKSHMKNVLRKLDLRSRWQLRHALTDFERVV
jgi:DNA-binding CsgD family transcriptional regulator